LVLHYRWQNVDAGFRMPAKVTNGNAVYRFIHPSVEWQREVISGISAADFEVNDEEFLIEVIEDD
jgi:hypothetical protein